MNVRTSTLSADLLLPRYPVPFPSSLGLPRALASVRRLGRARRIRRSLSSGAPLALGSPAAPWQPTAAGREEAAELFAALASAGPAALTFTTDSPAVLDHLAALAGLDRRHAVVIDLILRSAEPPLAAGRAHLESHHQALLRAARRLAEHGLLVRLVLAGSGELRASRDDLRALFTAARAAGAEDVAVHPSRGLEALRELVRRLRLEHGFPRGLPGRG